MFKRYLDILYMKQKHKIGYKLLRDNEDFYLCLLEVTGKVVANDVKYRTNEVFVHQIIRIHNLKKVKSVNHISFYDSTPILYNEKQYIASYLNTSSEICAEGIHYFPITGSSPENFITYFRHFALNFSNILVIFEYWFSNIEIKKEI